METYFISLLKEKKHIQKKIVRARGLGGPDITKAMSFGYDGAMVFRNSQPLWLSGQDQDSQCSSMEGEGLTHLHP